MKKTFTFGFKIKYLMIIIIIGLTQIVFFFLLRLISFWQVILKCKIYRYPDILLGEDLKILLPLTYSKTPYHYTVNILNLPFQAYFIRRFLKLLANIADR